MTLTVICHIITDFIYEIYMQTEENNKNCSVGIVFIYFFNRIRSHVLIITLRLHENVH